MIVLLQLLIMATGNYGFFNLLTIALCIPVVDDLHWPKWLKRLVKSPSCPWPIARWRCWPIWVTAPLAMLIAIITTMQVVEAFNRPEPIQWHGSMNWLREEIEPLRSINSYGLFRVMTTERREIIIEGSDDGATWKAYEFKYKPGDLSRAPSFCIPHMPRLDWQMWFAALGSYQQNQWVINFMGRLLEGSPPVLGLMGTNPFPEHPPKYVRAVLYEYHFTSLDEPHRQSGNWWAQVDGGLYAPAFETHQPAEAGGPRRNSPRSLRGPPASAGGGILINVTAGPSISSSSQPLWVFR